MIHGSQSLFRESWLRSIWWLASVVLLAACGGSDATNTEDQDDSLRHNLVLVMAGQSQEEFGRISSLATDVGGRIFVADAMNRRIVRWDPSNDEVAYLGASGSGPGEFRNLSEIAVIGDSTVAALDVIARRISLYNPSGETIGSVPWSRDAGRPGAISAAGDRLIAASSQLVRGPSPASGVMMPAGVVVEHFLVTGDLEFERLPWPSDTLAWHGGFDCEAGSTIHIFDGIFPSGGPYQAGGPEGRYYFISGNSVLFRSPSESTAQVLTTIEEPPIPLTDDEWGQLTQSIRNDLDGGEGDHCNLEALRPQSWPQVRSVVSNYEDLILIELTAVGGRSEVLVVRDSGEPVGKMDLPSRDFSVPLYARGDRVYLVQKDSLGQQSVNVYKISN